MWGGHWDEGGPGHGDSRAIRGWPCARSGRAAPGAAAVRDGTGRPMGLGGPLAGDDVFLSSGRLPDPRHRPAWERGGIRAAASNPGGCARCWRGCALPTPFIAFFLGFEGVGRLARMLYSTTCDGFRQCRGGAFYVAHLPVDGNLGDVIRLQGSVPGLVHTEDGGGAEHFHGRHAAVSTWRCECARPRSARKRSARRGTLRHVAIAR